MFDPNTLEQLGKFDLPARQAPPPGISPLKDTGGGVYNFMDNKDRIWNGTTTRHVMLIREQGNGFKLERDYDLSKILHEDERIVSVLPDWSGKMWFVARRDGVVGVLDPKTGKAKVIRLGNGLENEIENSFAVGKDGAYVATNRKMLRLRIGKNMPEDRLAGQLQDDRGITKPGQFDDGTGTTPTIMPGGYVAITDNADPMNVVVFRTRAHLKKGQSRKVCEVPVFEKGASDTENSLVNVGRSLMVENNYGYDVLTGDTAGARDLPWVRPRRRQQGRQGLPRGVDQRRARAERRPEGLARDRPDLHLHEPAVDRPGRPVVLDRDRLPHRQDGLQGPGRQRQQLEQPLRRDQHQPEGHRLRRRVPRRPLVAQGQLSR